MKREGIMQWKAPDFFACKTRAYATLSHLQGRYIPRLLAQVYLMVESPVPAVTDLPDDNDCRNADYSRLQASLRIYRRVLLTDLA